MVNFAGGDSHDLWIDPDDTNHIVHANDSGGAVSFNAQAAQRTWTARDYPTAQFYHVDRDRARAVSRLRRAAGRQHRLRAEQHQSRRRRTGGGGGGGGRGGAPELYSPGGAEPGYIAPDPNDPDIFYAGGNNGSFLTRLNRRTGEIREVSPYPRMFSGEPSSALIERWQWTYPIIFSPSIRRCSTPSSQHVWKTTNGGQTLGHDQRRSHAPRSEDDGRRRAVRSRTT